MLSLRQMSKSILGILNIKVGPHQAPILVSMAVCSFMFAYISPRLTKELITALPAEYLSIEGMTLSIMSILISILWKGKFRLIALKTFMYFAIVESIIGFSVGTYFAIVGFKPWIFAVFRLIYISLITMLVFKCTMMFKSRLWNNAAREELDNTTSIISNICGGAGLLASLIAMPSLEVTLMFWGISCIVDDLGWILVYRSAKAEILADAEQE